MEGAFRYLWARNLLSINSTDWVKRKNTTVKRKINPALHDELVFTWEKKIAEAVFQHKIPSDLISSFDQEPRGFPSSSKTTHTK